MALKRNINKCSSFVCNLCTLLLLMLFVTIKGDSGNNNKTSSVKMVEPVLSRQRRFLVFPEGSSLQVRKSIAAKLNYVR